MAESAELLDAREAMSMLGINENDLQQLVARGDLRAFRSAGTMKFRRDDVMGLKTEKGTEPTIIIPASASRNASGILPTVPMPAQRPKSNIMRAVQPAPPMVASASPHESATGEIVLDEIELMPTDEATGTQVVTAQQSAVGADMGGATIVDSGAATGEMTVLDAEPGAAPAPVTASGRRVAVSGSGIHGVPKPAMSRVQAAVGAAPGVSMATSRRTQAVYQAKSANPVWTAIAILNTLVFMVAASLIAVMMTKGHYDASSKQRVIPPFLNQNSMLPVYKWMYPNTPGTPEDKDRPVDEWPSAVSSGPKL